MMKNGDKDLINSIPLKSLKNSNFNISAIPPANLPDSYVLLFLIIKNLFDFKYRVKLYCLIYNILKRFKIMQEISYLLEKLII